MVNLDKENFGEKLNDVVTGVNKAVRKMLEESALRDETVVIGERNGQVKHVPARELLESFDQQPVLSK